MNLTLGSCAYNEKAKASFQRSGRLLLGKVAKLLGLKKGEYDLRYNPAGIACSGDHILHTDTLYIMFNLDRCDWVLVRKCKGRQDYRGEANWQYPFSKLEVEGAEGLAEFARKALVDQAQRCWFS